MKVRKITLIYKTHLDKNVLKVNNSIRGINCKRYENCEMIYGSERNENGPKLLIKFYSFNKEYELLIYIRKHLIALNLHFENGEVNIFMLIPELECAQTNTPPAFESPPPEEGYYYVVAFYFDAFMMCSYAASRFFISYLTLFNVSVI